MKNFSLHFKMASTNLLFCKIIEVRDESTFSHFYKMIFFSFIMFPFWPPLPLYQEPCLLSQGMTLTVKSTSRQNFQSICRSNSAKGILLLSLIGFMLKAASFQDRFHYVRRQLNCLFYFTFPNLVAGGLQEREINTRPPMFVPVVTLGVLENTLWTTQSMFYLINLL